MNKSGSHPRVLLALGSLALALTSCREIDGRNRDIEPEKVADHLVQHGFRVGATPGTFVDTEGNALPEEEALARTGRTTIRRGFGRFLFRTVGG